MLELSISFLFLPNSHTNLCKSTFEFGNNFFFLIIKKKKISFWSYLLVSIRVVTLLFLWSFACTNHRIICLYIYFVNSSTVLFTYQKKFYCSIHLFIFIFALLLSICLMVFLVRPLLNMMPGSL